jgi:hypothetical protein
MTDHIKRLKEIRDAAVWLDLAAVDVAALDAAIAALSHAAGQEVVAWILRTGHGTALHEGSRPPVEGVGWRPLVIAPAVARSEGEG